MVRAESLPQRGCRSGCVEHRPRTGGRQWVIRARLGPDQRGAGAAVDQVCVSNGGFDRAGQTLGGELVPRALRPECPGSRVGHDVVLEMRLVVASSVGRGQLEPECFAKQQLDTRERAELHAAGAWMEAVSPAAERHPGFGQLSSV